MSRTRVLVTCWAQTRSAPRDADTPGGLDKTALGGLAMNEGSPSTPAPAQSHAPHTGAA